MPAAFEPYIIHDLVTVLNTQAALELAGYKSGSSPLDNPCKIGATFHAEKSSTHAWCVDILFTNKDYAVPDVFVGIDMRTGEVYRQRAYGKDSTVYSVATPEKAAALYYNIGYKGIRSLFD